MEKSHFQRLLTLINLGVITSLHSPRTVRGRVRSRFDYATARDYIDTEYLYHGSTPTRENRLSLTWA